MKGVSFGEYRSDSYDLVLSGKEIDSPSPKLETIDIPGTDGTLDMTEYFGGVKYENRQLKFVFSTAACGEKLQALYSRILNDLNGRYFESIVIDDDPGSRYSGRVVSVKLSEERVSNITIVCSCDPYKKVKKSETVILDSLQISKLTFPVICGDYNGDGTVDEPDAVILIRQVEGRGSASSDIRKFDLNCDGTVDDQDTAIMTGFLSQSKYASLSDYIEKKQGIYRRTEKVIDFGCKITQAEFTAFIDHESGRPWYVYVDTESEPCIISTSHTDSIMISGPHKIIFKTPGRGNMLIEWQESRL